MKTYQNKFIFSENQSQKSKTQISNNYSVNMMCMC